MNKDEFDQPPGTIVRNMIRGGVGLPSNLALCALVGLSLLFLLPAFDDAADGFGALGGVLPNRALFEEVKDAFQT